MFWHIRLAFLTAGTAFSAFGIAMITSANLGTTPISAVPFAASEIFGLSFGTTTVIFNGALIAAQIILRRRLAAAILLQAPSAVVFGACIDLSMRILTPASALVAENSVMGAGMSLAGNVFLALGIVMQIRSQTIVQSGEGFVLALSARLKRPFGTLKVANDTALAAIAAVMELAELGGLSGIGAGTLVSVFLTGTLVRVIQERLGKQQMDEKPAG